MPSAQGSERHRANSPNVLGVMYISRRKAKPPDPTRSQPFVDGGDGHGGFVADGEFVEPGGDGPVAFGPVDAALDSVPPLVDFRVEGRWAAALRPKLSPVRVFVGLARDGRRDSTPAQFSGGSSDVYASSANTRSGRTRGRPASSGAPGSPLDGDKYHDNCHRYAEPVFTREQFATSQLYALNRRYGELWPQVTKGLSGKSAVSAWRRFIRQEQAAAGRRGDPQASRRREP
jgi:hypothetical protein